MSTAILAKLYTALEQEPLTAEQKEIVQKRLAKLSSQEISRLWTLLHGTDLAPVFFQNLVAKLNMREGTVRSILDAELEVLESIK